VGASSDGPGAGHVPVLVDEVLENLVGSPQGTYIDATFGRGGHSCALLAKLSDSARVLGVDRDLDAVAAAGSITDSRLQVVHGRFGQLEKVIEAAGLGLVDGILMDIGVSSPQLEVAERGFSFSNDGPLDMRMDQSQGETASAWIARAPEDEIVRVLRTHGEEKFARRIARAIVSHRPVESTKQLAEIVADALPAPARRKLSKHPATKTFQAIRIHINEEADELAAGLEQAFDALKPGGRLAVISFHSLEDRVVKRKFKAWSEPEPVPRRVPIKFADQKVLAHRIAGPLKAKPQELKHNPRARSAVLRILEKAGG
jgi:16S rRNA (cytosine1402-N4)-methyltransferase